MIENDRLQPSVSWTRNDVAGDWIYNVSLSMFRMNRETQSSTHTTDTQAGTGLLTFDQTDSTLTHEHRNGMHLTSRLQWAQRRRLGDPDADRRGQPGRDAAHHAAPAPDCAAGHAGRLGTDRNFAQAVSDGDNAVSMLRLNAQWMRNLGEGGRFELRGGAGGSRIDGQTLRTETDAAGALTRQAEDRFDIRDRSYHLNGKWSKLLDSEHNLVFGLEWERSERDEDTLTTSFVPSDPLVSDKLAASVTRYALYGQDEWELTPNWALHAGLRGEGIATIGRSNDQAEDSNRSQVWSPMLHAVWKPDPKGRDQIRMSLTRSYRARRCRT